MRSEDEIKRKLEEVLAANAKKRLPNPERVDIATGLSYLLQKGKYETLRDWEKRKAEVSRIASTFDNSDYRYRYCRRGLRGERIYDEKFESNNWVLASYVWALGIEDPAEMTILAYELNRRKRMMKYLPNR